MVKKFALSICLMLLFLVTMNSIIYAADEFADDDSEFKIAMNGTVKSAKNIGTGHGISITLPNLNSTTANNYILRSIETAVFERKSGNSTWTIYKDKSGAESKKVILNDVTTRSINIDFGKPSDYRVGAKYKIAYRYYVSPINDTSQIVIVNQSIKDGWRLIGETNGTAATNNGFTFYVNQAPKAALNYAAFTVNTDTEIDTGGKRIIKYTPKQSAMNCFPDSVLQNKKIDINVTVSDNDDSGMGIGYYIFSAGGNVLSKGILAGNVPAGTYTYTISDNSIADGVYIKAYAYDNFGGNGMSEDTLEMYFDTEYPAVTDEFDTQGYSIKGNNIYSRFRINDDTSAVLSDGEVYYSVKKKNSNGLYEAVSGYSFMQIPNSAQGTYTVDVTAETEGDYEISLFMIDKSYNTATHSLYVTLDNTPPKTVFLTQAENKDVTLYQTWTNQIKKMIFNASDTSGIRKCDVYLDNVIANTAKLNNIPKEHQFSYDVTASKQGKLTYVFYVYDNSRVIDKSKNTVNLSSSGNRTSVTKMVWIDKAAPSISIDIDETQWYQAPLSVPVTVSDTLSGIKTTEYAVMNSGEEPTEWTSFGGNTIGLNVGGTLYVKAIDNAGNITIVHKKVNINSQAEIVKPITPAESSEYTIHTKTQNGTMPVYVISPTAYSTKWEFDVSDNDINDVISADITLINRDNANIFIEINSTKNAVNNILRHMEFTTKYVYSENTALPDGVYDMYISLDEIKDGTVIHNSLYRDKKIGEIVIKRSSPPAPIITVGKENITIDYPDETLAASLNSSYIKDLYKRQYKYVQNGTGSEYKMYTDKIPTAKGELTALYTDCAGNISVSSKVIDTGGKLTKPTHPPISSDGDTALEEENRVANVFYIGIRRQKNSDINGSIFEFIK